VNYTIKSCYDKNSGNQTEPLYLDYYVASDSILLNYDFEQKCYSKYNIEYKKEGDQISIFIITGLLEDGCICSTDIEVELGPLKQGRYDIKVFKRADESEYLIDERELFIEGKDDQ
jgi:hypothetical protein